jgi:DNA repair protein RecN (Recombination protein N)
MLSRAYQLELLDHYLGSTKLRQKIAHSYKELELLKNELAVLEDTARTRAERLDFLCFQRDEIKLAELSPGDDEVLEKRSSLLKASEKLSQFINRAELALYSDEDSALVRMHRITQEATEFAHLDTQILKWSEKLMDAKALLEDAVYELRSLAKNTNLDASELEETLEKLSLLRKLQKKHGPTATAILERLLEIENEIEGLENSDTKIESLKASIDKITLELKLLAKELHSKRLKGAKTLTESVNKELTDLNMKGVHFGIKITELDELSSTGISDVEFTIQSGSKDEPRSLARFASGGELSRILLSLKRVVGDNDYPRTYLFDEVDAGVSGVTAEKVGKKLKSIAQNQQVISVTHLPQVAAFADAHFMISKENKKGAVIMNVLALDKNERVQELARLLSGEKITKASIENAKQLLR